MLNSATPLSMRICTVRHSLAIPTVSAWPSGMAGLPGSILAPLPEIPSSKLTPSFLLSLDANSVIAIRGAMHPDPPTLRMSALTVIGAVKDLLLRMPPNALMVTSSPVPTVPHISQFAALYQASEGVDGICDFDMRRCCALSGTAWCVHVGEMCGK